MWSDTFLAIERAHFIRVAVWGAACILVGTLLLALTAVRGARPPLVRAFAVQTAVWGIVEVALALPALRLLRPPDYAAAARFDHFIWWSLGIDLGAIAVGATLALAGWRLGRRLAPVGAGIGIAIHGVALVALDLVAIAQIGPSM